MSYYIHVRQGKKCESFPYLRVYSQIERRNFVCRKLSIKLCLALRAALSVDRVSAEKRAGS